MTDSIRTGRLAGFREVRARLLWSILVVGMASASLSGCHRHYYGNPDLSTEGYRYRAGAAVVGPDRDTLMVAVVVVNESNQQRLLPCEKFLETRCRMVVTE
jgi:hypothetical protein